MVEQVWNGIFLVNRPATGGAPNWVALGGQYSTAPKGTNFSNHSLFFDEGGGSFGDNLWTDGTGSDMAPVTFTAGQSFAVAVWVNIDSTGGGDDDIVAKLDLTVLPGNNDYEYLMQGIRGSSTYRWTVGSGLSGAFSGTTVTHSGTPLVADSYQLVVGQWDGPNKTAQISVDGSTLESTVGSNDNFGYTTSPLGIGRMDFQSLRAKMNMKFLGIWGRLLTQNEITRLYANGNGFAYPFPNQKFSDLPGPRL